jgi:allophanate hydrolase subunit 2
VSAADPGRAVRPARWPGAPIPDPVDAAHPLRIVPGPDTTALGRDAADALVAVGWTLNPTSDRVGMRLDGPRLGPGNGTELPSHGVVEGTVQLPPDGRPIVLAVDHQPTGGYPVVAVVVTVDLPRLGQLGPGAEVWFEMTTLGEARALLAADREAMDRACRELAEERGTPHDTPPTQG